MYSTKFAIAALTAAMVIVPITAFAQSQNDQRGGRHGKMFQRMDINSDGKISLEEMTKNATERFDKSDANNDGEITLEEMTNAIMRRRAERRAQRMLDRMDLNGDGKVTKAEIENRVRKRFALADRNDDGFVEKDEMRRGGRHMRGMGERGMGEREMGHRKGHRKEGHGRMMKRNSEDQ